VQVLGAEAHLAEGDPLQPQYLTDELMWERVRDQERRRHIERVQDEERVRGDLFVLEMISLEGERERGLQDQFEWDRGRERSIDTEEVKERAMERELQNFGEGGSALLKSTKIRAESQHAYNRETFFSDV
jgi:hypothetical protein